MLDWENCIQECSQNSPKPPQIFHFSSEPDRPVWKLQSTLRSKLGQPREEDSVAQITPVSHSSSYRGFAETCFCLGFSKMQDFLNSSYLWVSVLGSSRVTGLLIALSLVALTHTDPSGIMSKGLVFFLFPSLSLNKNQIYLLLLQNTE